MSFAFTVDPGIAGVTDQLAHLEFLGELGIQAGGHYLFRPAQISRSLPPAEPFFRSVILRRISNLRGFKRLAKWTSKGSPTSTESVDILTELGMNEALKRAQDDKYTQAGIKYAVRRIILSDQWMNSKNVRNWSELVAAFQAQLGSSPVADVLYSLRYNGPMKGFRHWFHGNTQSTFWNPVETLQQPPTKRLTDVLVHIRAGDLGVVKTNTDYAYARTFGKDRGRTPLDANPDWIEPTKVFDLISATAWPSKYLFCLHSDGFVRSHADANFYTRLSFDEAVTRGIADDQGMAEAFPGKSVIGESPANLRILFNDALSCRVAIVTHLGLMLPKFFGLLQRHGYSPPALCILYRNSKPQVNLVNFTAFGERIAFIDLDSTKAQESLDEFLGRYLGSN